MGAPDFILENGTGREVVPSISIANLIAQRDRFLALVAKASEILLQAQSIADDSGISDALTYRGFEWILLGPDRHNRDSSLLDPKIHEKVRQRADACGWDMLMRQSGLMTLMDAKARAEWRDSIENCKTPELTKENIASTFAQLFEQREDIFDRGVIQCFRRLSWDYKTNQPFKFGRRIILRIRSYGHFCHDRVNELEDLQRVFCVIDGKPEEDHRAGLYYRLSDSGRAHGEWRGVHDDVYMHIRWFKNGNGHITFKRADLVERLNQIIAKHFKGQLAHDPSVEAFTFQPVTVSVAA